VERVELSVKEGRIDIWVGYPQGTRFPCPECQMEYSIYDHQERVWRHLDSYQFHLMRHIQEAVDQDRRQDFHCGGLDLYPH